MRARILVAALGVALLAGVAPTVAHAGDPIMPLSELRPGMQCKGYSVIRGTAISEFDVEIVDVVSGDASSSDGPRILIRVSGPAVDRTGVGPGFSGSPIYCRDASGTAKNAGAISEAIGEYGGKTVLATPIEEMLANSADPPRPRPIGRRRARGARLGHAQGLRQVRARRARIGRVLPLAEPLTVSGLSRGLASRLNQAGARAHRAVLAAPAMPLTPFPPSPPRPGSSLSVGYSSGDIAVGAVGTVAYVDGDRVWGFGHPFEDIGLRSLLLQDAYVYTVINNPNAGDDAAGTTYKLAAPGHDLGTISNDASAAVVGRSGVTPPTIPVRVFSHDMDTGERSTLAAHVVDETDVGTPTGSSALSFVGPLAVAQGASAILRSAPGKLTGTVCLQITLRERRRPLHFCNRYVSAIAPTDLEQGTNIVAAGGAADALAALTELDDYKPRGLHVTEFAASVKLRRGLNQAFIRSVDLPRRVRPGRRVRARLHLQVVRGPRITRSFRVRIPRGLHRGRQRLSFVGRDVDDADSDVFGALVDTITIGGDEPGTSPGSAGASTLAQLARRILSIHRYDGVTLRTRGSRTHAYRDPELRISGRAAKTVRVVGRRRR